MRGLVCEGKRSPMRAAFTLIERVPSNNANTRRMKGIVPINCPIQTGSLTAERTRSAVTTSPEGNSRIEGELRVSPSGKANTQAAGKRTTASIVKVNWQVLLTEPASLGSRSSVRWEKAANSEEETGYEHSLSRRCKRGRHARRVNASNWGGPARFRYDRGKTKQRVDPLPQPRVTAVTSLRRSGTSGCQRIRDGIKRNAESRLDAVLGVGDAHSSEDRRDSKTRWERRGISLKQTSKEERSG